MRRKFKSRPRNPRDNYPTPAKAVPSLVPFLRRDEVAVFAEPCAGEGKLVIHLEKAGFDCALATDIEDGVDARLLRASDLEPDVFDAVITNPPYETPLMFEILDHLLSITNLPIWLLLEAGFMFNEQSAWHLERYCTDIVTVGRLKLIEGSPSNSTYDFCWYRFQHGNGGPRFHARNAKP